MAGATGRQSRLASPSSGNACRSSKEARSWHLAGLSPPLKPLKPICSPRAFWSALASWYRKDRRFARLARLYVGQRQDLIETGTDFQVRRRGEDPRFRGSAIRVAANVLRDRTSDVLQPADLAQRHNAYR